MIRPLSIYLATLGCPLLALTLMCAPGIATHQLRTITPLHERQALPSMLLPRVSVLHFVFRRTNFRRLLCCFWCGRRVAGWHELKVGDPVKTRYRDVPGIDAYIPAVAVRELTYPLLAIDVDDLPQK